MKKTILLLILLINLTILFADNNSIEIESGFIKEMKTSIDLTSEDKAHLKEIKKDKIKIGYQSYYDIEVFILKKILEDHFNLEVVLIKKSWKDLLLGMESGEIDLISNLSFTEDRADYIEYTQQYYTSKVFLIHPEKVNLENFNTLQGKTLIATEGSINIQSFKHLEEIYEIKIQSKPELNLKYVNNNTYLASDRIQVYSLIENGITELRYKEFFDTDPIYFGISKKVPEKDRKFFKKIFDTYLVKEMDEQLNNYLTYLNRNFLEKILTEEEVYFIKNLDKLLVGIDKEQYYISYQDKDRTYKGSWVDIIKSNKNENYKKRLVYLSSVEEKTELLEKDPNSIVLLPMNVRNLKKYNFSDSLYSLEYYMVKNKLSKNRNGIIGISSASYYLEDFKYRNKDNDYIVFDSNEDLIEAIESNKVGSIILSEHDLKYFQNEKLKTFLELEKSLNTVQIGVATSKGNEVLINLLKKRVKYNLLINEYIKKWKYTPNLVGVKYKQRTQYLYILTSLLLAALVVLIIMFRKIYLDNIYDQETGLPNIRMLRKKLKKGRHKGLIAVSVSNLTELIDSFSREDIVEQFKKMIELSDYPVYRINKNEYILASEEEVEERFYAQVETLFKEETNFYLNALKIEFDYGASHQNTSNFSEELIRNALYSLELFNQDKRFVRGIPEILEGYRDKVKVKRELEKALSEGKFIPYFQPKLNIENKRVNGAEILSRYTDVKGNNISPGVFIPILEDLNLIDRLDIQILKKSLVIVKELIEGKIVDKDFVVSQNLSIKTLEREDLFDSIKEIIEEVNFPTQNLEFEVTETALSEDMEKILFNLKRLKKLDVLISLDDFSAGNSSVNYINRFPIDIIKFDRSMLPIRAEEKVKGIIFTSFAKTFRELGYKIIAEGIETEWQNEFLLTTKVTDGQGYYYAKPLDEKVFETWLKNNNK